MLPTKFRFIWLGGFKGEDFKKQANQEQELPVSAMFVNGSGQNEQSLQRTLHTEGTQSFFYISHYSVTEINPFHDGSVAENTTEQAN